jgi:AcrR family transcriptional regulator
MSVTQRVFVLTFRGGHGATARRARALARAGQRAYSWGMEAGRDRRASGQLPPDGRREQLLRIGLEFFGTMPYGNVATAEVARRAGVSHGLLFHYFGDKRRYYLEVLRSVSEDLYSAQAVPAGVRPWDRLNAVLHARVRFAEQYPLAYRALTGGGNGADEEIFELFEDARWRSIRLITDALAITDPPAELRLTLRGWQGFTEGVITEWLKLHELGRDELVDLMAHELIALLRRRGIDLAATGVAVAAPENLAGSA